MERVKGIEPHHRGHMNQRVRLYDQNRVALAVAHFVAQVRAAYLEHIN